MTDVSLQNLPPQMPAEIGDMPTLNAVFLNNNHRLLTVPHSFGEAMKRGVGVLLDIHTRVLEAAEAQIGNWSTPGPGGEDARARYAPFASDGSVMTCAIACGMTLFRSL